MTMKVLLIGQLPKEVGGNYTTGAARVVYELSKQHVDGVLLFTFATNTPNAKAKKICRYPNQYIGYQINAIELILDALCHPIKTFREWRHYIKTDHQNPLRYTFYKINIRRIINEVQPDLIHVNSIGNVSPTRFAMGSKHIPLLLTCHGIFYRGDTNDKNGRDIYQGNLPLCDYFTGLTEEARHEFNDILDVSPSKYTIIPNGVDTTKFYYSEEWRRKVREEMGVDDDSLVFLTVASLQERKGQLAFIKILQQLKINFQYWLIGLGKDKEVIETYVKNYQLESKVKLLGYRNNNDLYKYYSAADVYAHTSWKEGQALSEIEAYSTGLRALINNAIKGTLIEDSKSENYCLVDFAHPDIEAIEKWIVSNNCFERASKKKYDWSNIMNRYAALYKELLNKKEKGAL